jgi:hypothetical protein
MIFVFLSFCLSVFSVTNLSLWRLHDASHGVTPKFAVTSFRMSNY